VTVEAKRKSPRCLEARHLGRLDRSAPLRGFAQRIHEQSIGGVERGDRSSAMGVENFDGVFLPCDGLRHRALGARRFRLRERRPGGCDQSNRQNRHAFPHLSPVLSIVTFRLARWLAQRANKALRGIA